MADDKVVRAELPPKPRLRCTRRGWCTSMERNLAPLANARAGGLSVVVISHSFSNKGFKEHVMGAALKKSASDKGVFCNYCPFCGAPIFWPHKTTKVVKGKG